jgi:predicted neuraminidase
MVDENRPGAEPTEHPAGVWPRGGRIFTTTSTDGGKSWSKLALTNLPNPNSGTDAVSLADGSHLLIYNHTAKGRSPLNLAASRDGTTWDAALVLESEPGEYTAAIIKPPTASSTPRTLEAAKIRHIVIDPKSWTRNRWSTAPGPVRQPYRRRRDVYFRLPEEATSHAPLLSTSNFRNAGASSGSG